MSGYGCLTIGKESEPFLFRGKWFIVNEMLGPVQVNKAGDPMHNQPSGRIQQAAYEFWRTAKMGYV